MEPITEIETLDCQVNICDHEGNSICQVDVIEAQIRLDSIRLRCKEAEEIIKQFQEWFIKRHNLTVPISYSRAYNILKVVDTMFAEVKKKQDAILKLQTTTESTLSNLAPSSY